VSRYAEPMARLIEELKKLPAWEPRARSALPSTFCAPATRMRRRWPRRCAASRQACACARSATTSPMSIPAPTAPAPRATGAWSAWSRSPPTLPPWSATRSSHGGYQGVYHVLHGTLSPLHGVGPDQLRAGTLVAASSAARWTRSSWPPVPRSKAKPLRTGWPARCALFRCDHPHRNWRPGRQRHRIRRRGDDGAGAGGTAGALSKFFFGG
jgi:hypothetical protein